MPAPWHPGLTTRSRWFGTGRPWPGTCFRYLQVDALPAGRPILERLVCHPLAQTTPWMLESAAG
jgi:hypothetical protein